MLRSHRPHSERSAHRECRRPSPRSRADRPESLTDLLKRSLARLATDRRARLSSTYFVVRIPSVDLAHGLSSEPLDSETQPDLVIGCLRVARAHSGESQALHVASERGQQLGLLLDGHAAPDLELNAISLLTRVAGLWFVHQTTSYIAMRYGTLANRVGPARGASRGVARRTTRDAPRKGQPHYA